MKKLLLICALAIGGYSISNAQTPIDVYNAFAAEAKAKTVSVGDFALKLAGEYDDVAKKIESVRVLALSECSQAVKDKFAVEVGKLNTKGYETIVRVNKDDEMVRLLAKVKDDVVNELLVIVTGKEPVLVTLKGTMSKSELLSKADKIKIGTSVSL